MRSTGFAPRLMLVLAIWACTDDPSSVASPDAAVEAIRTSSQTSDADLRPSPLATATLGDRSAEFWPYTGTNFRGTAQDPINLLFFGENDPRQIRAALMSLDGNRSAYGFPPVMPFNCTWSDAIGNVQTAFATEGKWLGSAVQLECGPYGPIRFHMRLFRAGTATIGNVHFEVLIPGTTEHEVLSWKLAQDLVTADLVRSGLLGRPPAPTAMLHPTEFHEIRAPVYNGLPVELRGAIGGPLSNVTANVPIRSSGVAMMFELARSVDVVRGYDVENFVVNWNQVIPKPFCSQGPSSYVLVQGPVTLQQRAGIDALGTYSAAFIATGTLQLTPVNPLTSPPTPVEPTYTAKVLETHGGFLTNRISTASMFQLQMELPSDGPFRGTLRSHLRVGPTKNASDYTQDIDC
jgi:hypothetical protein